VKAAKEKLRVEESRRRHTVAPAPRDPDAVMAQVELQTTELSVLDAIPESSREVWKHVDATLKKLNAEQILKYAFYRHVERVEVMVALEKKLGILTPNGYKEMEALRSIGDSIHKVEVQELFLRGKHGELPAGTDVSQPQLSDFAVGMAQFDEVDRNLIREASVQVIELIE
jgi:hypothetical protein